MAEVIQIEQFLDLSAKYPVVDVRSPGEFNQGHVPGAFNIPLFDDHERKVVGTKYKQVNRESAMYAGLEFVGKKLVDLAKEGERRAGRHRHLLVHCWRGGMRSRSMAWLFETVGITCYLLEGGYKTYRRFAHSLFERSWNLVVIGGKTGSGKTEILHRLHENGEQIIDLEGMAHHKGSAFGALGEEEQPSTEHFENLLANALMKIDGERKVWIEDESRNVGKCVIPGALYNQMKRSTLLFLDIPVEARATHLVKHYAAYPSEDLKACIERISKKLGGDRTKEAMESVDRKDFYETAMITLRYYDKAYMFSLNRNHSEYTVIKAPQVDGEHNALLLQHTM